jgi:hypothetical protein
MKIVYLLGLLLLTVTGTALAQENPFIQDYANRIAQDEPPPLHIPVPPIAFLDKPYEAFGLYCTEVIEWIPKMYDSGQIVIAVYESPVLVDQEPQYLELWSDVCVVVTINRNVVPAP